MCFNIISLQAVRKHINFAPCLTNTQENMAVYLNIYQNKNSKRQHVWWRIWTQY